MVIYQYTRLSLPYNAIEQELNRLAAEGWHVKHVTVTVDMQNAQEWWTVLLEKPTLRG